MAIASWVYTYVQTYHIVHFKYVKFTVCQLYFNKTFFFKDIIGSNDETGI